MGIKKWAVVRSKKFADLFNFGEVGDGKWIEATVNLYSRMKDKPEPEALYFVSMKDFQILKHQARVLAISAHRNCFCNEPWYRSMDPCDLCVAYNKWIEYEKGIGDGDN